MTVQGSFEDWYREVHPRTVRCLVALAGGPDQADDAVSEAFVRALSRWDQVSAMESPAGWIFRAAENVLKRRLHREAMERAVSAVLPWTRELVTQQAPVEALDVRAALAGLSFRSREVLVLSYIGDFSESEIASILRIPPGTVKSRLHLARRQAKDVFIEPMLEVSGV